MLKPSIRALLAFGLICFLNCVPKKNKEASIQEFEGVITYHEVEKTSNGDFNLDDTVQLYYSHGNYVSIHSETKNVFHVVKDYYLKDQALRLWLFNNSDTLHQLSLNSSVEKLDSFKVRKINERIHSRQCEEINIKASYPETDSTTYTDFTLTFSRGYLPVNKEHFKTWKLGFFNKVIDESGAFYLKFKAVHYDSSHKNILSIKTYDVISVKEQIVNPKIFQIDKNQIKWAK